MRCRAASGDRMIADMSTELMSFRELYIDLRDSGAGDGWGPELVLPWLERNPQVHTELAELGRPENARKPIPPDRVYYTAREGLYAFSRIVEILISAYQPEPQPAPERWWRGAVPGPDVYPAFAHALGGVHIGQSSFHPFFHEIVSVQPADDPDEPPTLVHEYWPGLMIGSLLVVRSGVGVRAGRNVFDPDVASGSCLFFAWWRRNRLVGDLSHGWGSNSQWGTDFRRDYLADGAHYYNVDGQIAEPPRSRLETELSEVDHRWLLRYRCSVRVDFGPDRWPYDDYLVEPASSTWDG
jgi:hypothetical protein